MSFFAFFNIRKTLQIFQTVFARNLQTLLLLNHPTWCLATYIFLGLRAGGAAINTYADPAHACTLTPFVREMDQYTGG